VAPLTLERNPRGLLQSAPPAWNLCGFDVQRICNPPTTLYVVRWSSFLVFVCMRRDTFTLVSGGVYLGGYSHPKRLSIQSSRPVMVAITTIEIPEP
jgi:hypothetical protein